LVSSAAAIAAEPPSTGAPDVKFSYAVAKRTKTSFVTKAVKSVGPSVVRIDVKSKGPKGPLEQLANVGSGVILNQEGLIVTNAHVVNNADTIRVTLTDGRVFDGSVQGIDKFMDLAAVTIPPSEPRQDSTVQPINAKLPTATLASDDDVQVGDYAIAVGNAQGLDSTVTVGIISSRSRSANEMGDPSKKVNFLQTDAVLNPGNSGGPLVNEFGDVIGINTAIRANAQGIGFAIPIGTTVQAMKELSAGRKIQHPFIGVTMQTITKELAAEANKDPNAMTQLPEEKSTVIVSIGADTPASRSGFRRMDVVLEVDGTSVSSSDDVVKIVDNSNVGQKLTFKIVRDLNPQTIEVTTGELGVGQLPS
jgi:S1-C subfamily serine protease